MHFSLFLQFFLFFIKVQVNIVGDVDGIMLGLVDGDIDGDVLGMFDGDIDGDFDGFSVTS
jgi:hypothetical protein